MNNEKAVKVRTVINSEEIPDFIVGKLAERRQLESDKLEIAHKLRENEANLIHALVDSGATEFLRVNYRRLESAFVPEFSRRRYGRGQR